MLQFSGFKAVHKTLLKTANYLSEKFEIGR